MGKKWTYKSLEEFGRVRLSSNFYMRDFLHSEISQVYGLLNAPSEPDLAIKVGRRLCEEVLEPIGAVWGKIHVRSGYRSAEVNRLGNAKKLNCANNNQNAAAHIWDELDESDMCGATSCIVLPQYQNYYEKTGDWASLAWWIHRNIPSYHEMCFFKLQCALNVRWYEASDMGKTIKTHVINPDTGNKKSLITDGIVADEYSDRKISKCVNRAINVISNST
jgi:hypothetical protein